MTDAAVNELEQLVGDTPAIEVRAGGETIRVSPIKVRELSPFMKAVEPMLAMIDRTDRNQLVTDLLVQHTDSLIRAVAIGVRKSEDFINALDIDELIELAAVVIEVNTDFFIQRVLPKVAQGTERLESRMNNLGGLNSTSVSEA